MNSLYFNEVTLTVHQRYVIIIYFMYLLSGPASLNSLCYFNIYDSWCTHL